MNPWGQRHGQVKSNNTGRGGEDCLNLPIQESEEYQYLLERRGITWLNRKGFYKAVKFQEKSEIGLYREMSKLRAYSTGQDASACKWPEGN